MMNKEEIIIYNICGIIKEKNFTNFFDANKYIRRLEDKQYFRIFVKYNYYFNNLIEGLEMKSNIQEWTLIANGRADVFNGTNMDSTKFYGSENEAKIKLSKYINKEAENLRQKGFVVNGTLNYDEFHVYKNSKGVEIGYEAFINVYDEHKNYRIVYCMKKHYFDS